MGELKSEKLKVFIRLGANDQERRIAFFRPDRISTAQLLGYGFAIDGNQACRAVVAQEGGTLPAALHDEEVWLIGLLEQFGYDVEFI